MRRSKPKVLLLGPLPPPYMGPSIATEIILGSSLREEFDLVHLNTNTHRSLGTLYTWRVGGLARTLGLYLQMLWLVIRSWPDLVLVPISQTTVGFSKDSIYILISRALQRRTLLQLRGSDFGNWLDGASRLTRWFVSSVLRSTQGVIVLGEKLRYLFRDHFDDRRIFVVSNGADYVIPPCPPRGDRTRLLYLGNMQRSKGIEDVLLSLVTIKKQGGPVVRLDVVGTWRDGEMEARCRELVNGNGLAVVFHGTAVGRAKLEFLASADMLVFTPRAPEGHPWVIVEALAAGLPIVSTDQGAITESVIDGWNGFIVEPGRPEQIAERVTRLVLDTGLRARMGERSRSLYEDRFTGEHMAQNLGKVFREVIGSDTGIWFDGLADLWARNYVSGGKTFRGRLEVVHGLIADPGSDAWILDVGCGTGEIGAFAQERFGCRMIGMDLSPDMIRRCKDTWRGERLWHEIGDVRHLGFRAGVFDLVIGMSVIEWIEDYENAVEELARVLKPGGQCIASIPNWRSPLRAIERGLATVRADSYLRHQRNRVPVPAFAEVAERFGLQVEKTIYHVIPPSGGQLKGRVGEWLGMMCVLSMRKVGSTARRPGGARN